MSWILPKPFSVYRGVEVNRCEADGLLVTPKMDLKPHAGHKVRSPVCLTLKEKLLIWLKIIQ